MLSLHTYYVCTHDITLMHALLFRFIDTRVLIFAHHLALI